MSATLELITTTLRDKFKVTADIAASTNIEEIGLDSLDFINFLYTLEETTGVKIPDEDIESENLESLADFARYIDARRS
ncbi:MAG: acyl carrier protein [Candidatus Eiseniibacteriota bacterium]